MNLPIFELSNTNLIHPRNSRICGYLRRRPTSQDAHLKTVTRIKKKRR